MGNDLARRVADQNGRGEVEQKKPATLDSQIRNMQSQFELAMPRGAEARQLVRDALTLLRGNPNLAKCTSESVLGGLMTFAQLGLRPGVMGHGWLLPFERRKKQGNQWVTTHWEAQIVIGYKGLAELVHRSGRIETMVGRAVHENDQFELEYGLTDQLVHRPARGSRGPVVGYYAIIKYQGGGHVFWHMSREEAVEWRNAHAMSAKKNFNTGEIYGSGPWFDETKGPDGGTGFDQMALKTCALRAMRWAPKATDTAFAQAAEVDGTVRLNVDTDPDAILDARQPEQNNDVIDVELDEPVDVPEVPAQRDERPAPAPEPAPTAPGELQTEFPVVPGNGTDGPALQSQQKRMHALLGEHADTDERRWFLLGKLTGRPGAVKSASDLTKREAAQVVEYLTEWEKAGTLAAQLDALHPMDAPPAEENLPAVGSSAWHDDQHPEKAGNGKVVRVAQLLNGDCGFCEEDAAGGGDA